MVLSSISPLPADVLANIKDCRLDQNFDINEETTEVVVDEGADHVTRKDHAMQFCKVLARLAVAKVHAPKFFDCYRGPITGALTCYSLAASGVEAWHLGVRLSIGNRPWEAPTNPQPAAPIHPIPQSPCGRVDRGSQDDVVQESLEHLRQVMSSRSALGQKHFEEVCARLCSQVSRPASVKNLPKNAIRFKRLESEVRDDNWYHCRRLMQLLAQLATFSVDEATRHETNLMLVLAAVEAGTSEPLPWLVVLDGALKKLWHETKGSSGGHELRTLKLVMEELTVFAHATAIKSLEGRFESFGEANPGLTSESQPSDLVCWYAMLYEINSRCANSQCCKLLPHPSGVKAPIRGVFSVGTREARVGHPSIRAFISENREWAYPCLVFDSDISWRRPHSVLIAMFFWYSEIFHLGGCRPLRGKWAMNFV